MPVLDARTARGPTALHLAAAVGNIKMVRLLLEAGAGAQSDSHSIVKPRGFGSWLRAWRCVGVGFIAGSLADFSASG